MEVGDLVKLKFATYAELRRFASEGWPVNELGIIIKEESSKAYKILFPSSTYAYTLLGNCLELVNESR